MWNHAQSCLPFGDGDNCESGNQDSSFKERIEKSLDLTQYLKYLDQLFSQTTSESESSDNDEGSRSFNDFLQPPSQTTDRSQVQQYNQSSGFLSASQITGCNLTALKTSDGFHTEANISSSSLSSVDSGTSSLSFGHSADFFSEASLTKIKIEDEKPRQGSTIPQLKSPNLCADNSSSADDDKPKDKGSKKDKKPRKKKKSSKGSGETIPRQDKPSSDGRGNNGSKGGEAGGSSAVGGNSGESFNNKTSSGNSSSNQGNASDSSGAKSRSGTQTLEPSNTFIAEKMANFLAEKTDVNHCPKMLPQSKDDFSMITLDADELLLNDELTDNFSGNFLSRGKDKNTFSTNILNSFPLTAIIDINEDSSLSDYISISDSNAQSTSLTTASEQQPSTNSFEKTATTVPTEKLSNNFRNVAPDKSHNSLGMSENKRKPEFTTSNVNPEKVIKLSEKQNETRIQYLNAKRRKIYVGICRKEIGKTQRNRTSLFKESLLMKRRLAVICERHVRKNAQQSEKCMLESVCKAKKLTQEMEMHWKKVEREKRDLQRMKEKQAEEKQKEELEMLNRKAKEEKFDRLLTHIELFSVKLLKSKMEPSGEQEMMLKPDGIIDECKTDKSDCEGQDLATVQVTVTRALNNHQNLVKLLDMSGMYSPDLLPLEEKDITQPQMFEGILQSFQIKGINWIKHLYIKGLNGILVDEVGLGKKLQVVAFLCHLAEACHVWGPFLIVTSSSSLPKWMQLFQRLSPRLKVVLYLGKPLERKILRRFGERNNLSKEDSNFHVVITSYPVMVTDLKYFSKVKWQYLIMDDSQGAITSSTKWMPLLSFRCRNKLLLSNCPQLNSSSTLCSYLYFVMPSLFDSHEEFSEWLLQELEAQSKRPYEIDERGLTRLRSVAERFLLGRTKQEIENEQAYNNVNVQLFCELSFRQRLIYSHLLKRAKALSFLEIMENCNLEEKKNHIRKLLNLSMQLSMVCNHPDLVKKRVSVPFWMDYEMYGLPRLIFLNGPAVFDTGCLNSLVNRLFCIYSSLHVYKSLFKKDVTDIASSTWSFTRFLEMSFGEVEDLFIQPVSSRLNYLVKFQSLLEKINFESIWKSYGCQRTYFMQYPCSSLQYCLRESTSFENLVYFSSSAFIYGVEDLKPCGAAEPIEYRSLKCRKVTTEPTLKVPLEPELNSAKSHRTQTRQLMYIPALLHCFSDKVGAAGYKPLVLCSRLKHKWSSFSQIIESACDFKQCSAAYLLRNSYLKSFTRFTRPDKQQFVLDSGKLKRLDGLLTSLKNTENVVLLCSYNLESIDILQEYLACRKRKYVIVNEERMKEARQDTSLYILFVGVSMPAISTLNVDTVVFFDQDWTTMKDDNTKIINQLANPSQVNCYQLTSINTIEEKIMSLPRENIVPTLDIKQSSSILKNLISILKCEANFRLMDASMNEEWIQHQPILETTDKNVAPNDENTPVCIYNKSNGVINGKVQSIENADVDQRSDSLSSDDKDMDVDTFDGEFDNFFLRFDEGYLNNSSESFEQMKSDYEEESSSTKSRLGRGNGKRGRPPSKFRLQKHDRDLGDGPFPRRGPGRPRLKPVGPANHGIRGRRPGRPPLTKKAESIASTLTTLTSGPKVFGFYSSPDLEFS